jgi:hypothetical protein
VSSGRDMIAVAVLIPCIKIHVYAGRVAEGAQVYKPREEWLIVG